MVVMSFEEATEYLCSEQKSQKNNQVQLGKKVENLEKEIQALRTKMNTKQKGFFINVTSQGLD